MPTENLSQAQIDRITQLTNERGAAFGYPVAGLPDPVSYPYTFVSTRAENNALWIEANMTVDNKNIDEKQHANPVPEPGAELDALVNAILQLVERTAMLKFGR